MVPQDKSGRVRLPLTWRGARRTIDFGSFRLRHLCLEIGLRARTRGTLLVTFVGSFHHSKIMLRVLVKVLCVDAIATCRRLPPKGDVTFKDLIRVASDFDVRTVTIEGLTSGRYLLPIRVGIVTVIATMRSTGLSWSHDTCCVDGEIGSLSNESISELLPAESEGIAPLFCTSAKLFRAGTLDGAVLISNRFLVQCPAEAGLIGAPVTW